MFRVSVPLAGFADHDSKGNVEPGDSNRGRGASARVNVARLNYPLTTMSREDVKVFDIAGDQRRRYFRMDSSKVNLCPPNHAKWYELISVELGNRTDRHPEGDHIQ